MFGSDVQPSSYPRKCQFSKQLLILSGLTTLTIKSLSQFFDDLRKFLSLLDYIAFRKISRGQISMLQYVSYTNLYVYFESLQIP